MLDLELVLTQTFEPRTLLPLGRSRRWEAVVYLRVFRQALQASWPKI